MKKIKPFLEERAFKIQKLIRFISVIDKKCYYFKKEIKSLIIG
jgi:hypothetical protein